MSLHEPQHNEDRIGGTPVHADPIAEMQHHCVELFGLLERERSGIRDGDGTWHGCDPIHGTIERLTRLADEVSGRG